MDPYRPFARSISIAFGIVVTLVLPTVGLLSVGLYALSAIPLTFVVVCFAIYLLLHRRGRHAWNVDSLDITIQYHDDAGHQVTVTREQTIYPNRSHIRAARIRLSLGADPYKLDQRNPGRGSTAWSRAVSACAYASNR